MKPRFSDFEIRFYERVLKEKPDHLDALMILADVYTRKGLYDRGLEMDERLSKLCQEDPIVHYNLACSYALTGKRELAVAALQKAVQLGYDDLPHLLKDPDLKTLHNDPAFEALIRDFPLKS